jgi:hypothetical protein
MESQKTMVVGKRREELQIRIENGILEQVTKFVYLGGLITEDGRCEEDIKRRIGLAFGKLGKCGEKNFLHAISSDRLASLCRWYKSNGLVKKEKRQVVYSPTNKNSSVLKISNEPLPSLQTIRRITH